MYIRLKELRIKNNFSKKDISNYLKISLSQYSNYENGKKDIPINILSKLAKKYKTSIDYIVEDTDQILPY